MVGQVGQNRHIRTHLGNNKIVEVCEQIVTQAARIISVLVQIPRQPEHLSRVFGQDRFNHPEQGLAVGHAQGVSDRRLINLAVAPRHHLVEE